MPEHRNMHDIIAELQKIFRNAEDFMPDNKTCFFFGLIVLERNRPFGLLKSDDTPAILRQAQDDILWIRTMFPRNPFIRTECGLCDLSSRRCCRVSGKNQFLDSKTITTPKECAD